MSVLGLSKCFDPRATKLQKLLYCTRLCCLLAGITAGYIAEKTSVTSKTHKIASICCSSSWAVYTILLH
jgi:hypothetical protein